MSYALSKGGVPLLPSASLDWVRIRLPIPHSSALGTKPMQDPQSGVWFPTKPLWVPLKDGGVNLYSRGRNADVILEFNPSTQRYGHNLNAYRDDLQRALVDVIPQVYAARPDVFAELHGDITFAYECLQVVRLDICADFRMPSQRAVQQAVAEIRTRWRWAYNKRINREFTTSGYIEQGGWQFLYYDKARHMRDKREYMPASVHQLAENRLRLEVKLYGARELRKFGSRRQDAYEGTLNFDFTNSANWHARTYDQALDYYLARIVPVGNKRIRGVVPLYHLMAAKGARPLWSRGTTYGRVTPSARGVWQAHLAPRRLTLTRPSSEEKEI
jgi:hypothetical protein